MTLPPTIASRLLRPATAALRALLLMVSALAMAVGESGGWENREDAGAVPCPSTCCSGGHCSCCDEAPEGGIPEPKAPLPAPATRLQLAAVPQATSLAVAPQEIPAVRGGGKIQVSAPCSPVRVFRRCCSLRL